MDDIRALPTDMTNRYRFSYETNLWAGSWRHMFIAVGAGGAVHLHISKHHYDGVDNWSAGLEFHWRSPPDYMKDQPPSHDECQILKCPCWHDGTSLYAREFYLPKFQHGDFAGIFRSLARDADEKLATKPEDE